MKETCALPECNRPVTDTIRQPVCGHHAMTIYRQVRDTMDELAATTSLEDAIPTTGRARPLAGQRLGVVYFMRFGDLIKIGYTTNLPKRVKALGPDEVLAVMPGTMQTEKFLHAKFGPWWVRGEYFNQAPELLAYIAEVGRDHVSS